VEFEFRSVIEPKLSLQDHSPIVEVGITTRGVVVVVVVDVVVEVVVVEAIVISLKLSCHCHKDGNPN